MAFVLVLALSIGSPAWAHTSGTVGPSEVPSPQLPPLDGPNRLPRAAGGPPPPMPRDPVPDSEENVGESKSAGDAAAGNRSRARSMPRISIPPRVF